MAIEQVDRTDFVERSAAPAPGSVAVSSRRTARTGPGAAERIRRVVVLMFGLVQIVIGLRFVLLLMDARATNGIVSGIVNLSGLFVAPFEGILRTNTINSAGSVFDVTAIVAFAGWTVLELIVIWAVAIFRREPA